MLPTTVSSLTTLPLIIVFIFFIVCYFFSEHLYGFLVDPFAKAVKDDGTDRRLIFTALQETFLTYLKVSFFAAFFVAFIPIEKRIIFTHFFSFLFLFKTVSNHVCLVPIF